MQSVDNKTRQAYNKGWQANGSWHCHKCGTIIGKNLLGQRPVMLAFQHAETCNGTLPIYKEKDGDRSH